MPLTVRPPRPQQLEVGTTYWPAGVGPYLWHEFSPDTVAQDLAAIAARRVPVVRILLSWDAFMPTDRVPNPLRMQELESVLRIARDLRLRLVLTMFAQSLGDCVMLPAYAIDPRFPRRDVRCLSEGRVVAGGARDIYTDPLMLETQVRWMESMLAAFSHHPAVAAWDLGYDPARTVRPRRIEDMRRWAALLAELVHEQDEECRLTLGQADVLQGRAVRLPVLATAVDRLTLVLRPQQLPLPGDPLAAGRAAFVVALAMALLDDAVPLGVDLGVAVDQRSEDERADPDGARSGIAADPVRALRACDEMLQRMTEMGVVGITSTSWSDWGPRLAEAAPADRNPWMMHEGIVDTVGESAPIAQGWEGLLSGERATAPVARGEGLPMPLDADEYYANLPDALRDVYATWEGDLPEAPAILG